MMMMMMMNTIIFFIIIIISSSSIKAVHRVQKLPAPLLGGLFGTAAAPKS